MKLTTIEFIAWRRRLLFLYTRFPLQDYVLFYDAAQESTVFLRNKHLCWDPKPCCGNIYRWIKVPRTHFFPLICARSRKRAFKQLERSRGAWGWGVKPASELLSVLSIKAAPRKRGEPDPSERDLFSPPSSRRSRHKSYIKNNSATAMFLSNISHEVRLPGPTSQKVKK